MVTGLPSQLWRVVWWQGFGWPTCERRERTQRTYATAERAARMVRTVEAWPSHHVLVGVWTTTTVWEPVALEELPEPEDPDWEDS